MVRSIHYLANNTIHVVETYEDYSVVQVKEYRILIDNEDVERVLDRRWYPNRARDEIRFRSYAKTKEEHAKVEIVYMTRFILNIPLNDVCRVGLHDATNPHDYRKSNLYIMPATGKAHRLYTNAITNEQRNRVNAVKRCNKIQRRYISIPYVTPQAYKYKYGLWFVNDKVLHLYNYSQYEYGNLERTYANVLWRRVRGQCGVRWYEDDIRYVYFTKINLNNLKTLLTDKHVCPQCFKVWLDWMVEYQYIKQVKRGNGVPFPVKVEGDFRDKYTEDEVAWYDL